MSLSASISITHDRCYTDVICPNHIHTTMATINININGLNFVRTINMSAMTSIPIVDTNEAHRIISNLYCNILLFSITGIISLHASIRIICRNQDLMRVWRHDIRHERRRTTIDALYHWQKFTIFQYYISRFLYPYNYLLFTATIRGQTA